MSAPLGGLLAVWMDADPAAEADFNAWYSGQHLLERVGVPGFLSGSRYAVLRGAPRYLGVYDTRDADVLTSAPYLARLNDPTPWTQRVMPVFRNTVRAACRIVAAHGRGVGGTLRTVRLEPTPGRHDALRAGLQALVNNELATRIGTGSLLRVRLAEQVAGGPVQSAEVALRGADRGATFVLLLDAHDAATLSAVCDAALREERLRQLGAATPVQVGDYRLLYALTHDT